MESPSDRAAVVSALCEAAGVPDQRNVVGRIERWYGSGRAGRVAQAVTVRCGQGASRSAISGEDETARGAFGMVIVGGLRRPRRRPGRTGRRAVLRSWVAAAPVVPVGAALLCRDGITRRRRIVATDDKLALDVEGSAAVERFEHRTEIPLAVLAVVFFAAYAWPILQPDLSQRWKDACRLINYVIWVIFAVEFLIRICLVRRRGRYMSRHVPDVLMLALPVLRPLRVLRLLVLLQMVNRRATSALRGRVAVYVGGSAVLILFSAALAMLDAERGKPNANIHTFGDALWWAASTMTTVGYGDRTPTTGQGRAVGFAVMLAGIAVLGVVTASIAAWLIDRVREADVTAQAATRGDIDALRAEVAMLRQALSAGITADPSTSTGSPGGARGSPA